ncbi:helix-turn-helix domain-containing protein [Brevundimonas naejangsanensis]|uniref:helix-turn-helix domain-containing protein n=1 Tax=Brevundimonas naejangsanensis TaxID=588932 RepID=UPI0026EAF97A|nr:LysR family transcriptional regulator [Brevundimonas naejangsanensis]
MRKNRANHPRRKLHLGDLRLAWLVTFLAVVRLKNRSLAAKELGLTQGAVTKQLRSLEDWSCRGLIWEDSAPVRLTPQGEDFVKVAEDTLEILTKFRMPPPMQAEPPKAKISGKDLRVPPSVPKSSVI